MDSCTKGLPARAVWTRCVFACRDRVLALGVVLLAQAVLAVGCGAPDEPAPPAAPLSSPAALEAPEKPELQLPIVGTAGRAPDGPSVIQVGVDADGRIEVDGEGPLSLEALRQVLYDRTRDRWWRDDDGASSRLVLIDADARVPWVVPYWVMQAGTIPSTRLRRCFLGVWCRDAHGGAGLKRGALACFLPRSPYVIYENRQTPSPRLTVQMAMHEGAASDPGDILPALRARMAEAPEVAAWLTLRADEDLGAAVPTGFVAQVLDVALAAGAKELLLEGPRFPSPAGALGTGRPEFDPADVDALLAYVAKLKALDARPRLTVPGLPLPAQEDSSRPPERGCLDALYGGGLLPDETEPPPRRSRKDEEAALERLSADGIPLVPAAPDADLRLEDDVDGILAHPVPPGMQRRRGLRGERVEDVFLKALRWFAAQQLPNGAWGSHAAPRGEVRSTGLALLAFSTGGYGWRGDHEYAAVVRRGIAWLQSQQDDSGFVGDRQAVDAELGHAAAALALVQANCLAEDPRVESAMGAALRTSLAWHEGPAAPTAAADTTMHMALPLIGAWIANERARREGAAAPFEPAERTDRVVRELPARLGVPDGDVAAAARAWLLGLVADPRDANELQQLRAQLVEKAAEWTVPAVGTDPAVWWFASMALHQGDPRNALAWRRHLHPRGVESQAEGLDATAHAGSWAPSPGDLPALDRLKTTALMALAYAVAYRYDHAFGVR